MGLATDPGFLVAPERGVRRVQVIAVGPHTACLDAAAHAVGAIDIAGPYPGAQPELSIVGNGQRLGFVLEGSHAHHRPEDLLLEHAHLVVPLEQGRLDVIARGQVATQSLAVTAGQHLCTFFLGDLQVGKNLVVLLLRGLGTHHGFGVQRIAALDLADLFQHLFHERLIDRLLHQGP
ncbi:hypothetical protein D3C77_555470 [compost metagenome]